MTATGEETGTEISQRAMFAGWAISIVEILFLLLDAVTKLIKVSTVVTATTALGFPEHTIRFMGVLLILGLVLYAIPRSSVFGAVFITAYLGGAVCANVRVDAPLFTNTLAPVYTAVALWLGLYLRSAALRQLVRTGY